MCCVVTNRLTYGYDPFHVKHRTNNFFNNNNHNTKVLAWTLCCRIVNFAWNFQLETTEKYHRNIKPFKPNVNLVFSSKSNVPWTPEPNKIKISFENKPQQKVYKLTIKIVERVQRGGQDVFEFLKIIITKQK
jgi:hypothetical protein